MSDLSFAVESLTCTFTPHLNIKGGNVLGSPLHTSETLFWERSDKRMSLTQFWSYYDYEKLLQCCSLCHHQKLGLN